MIKLTEHDFEEMNERVKYDIEAFTYFYELNHRRIFNYILYNTGDVELALDLTAETFFKAFKFKESFNPERASFTSWLYGIASKEIAMYFRKRKRELKFGLSNYAFPEDIEKARLYTDSNEIEDARKRLEVCEGFIAVTEVLQKLPQKQREILALRLFEDLPFEQIAALLHKEVGAIKNRYYRALKKLRKMLQLTSSCEGAFYEYSELSDDDSVL